MSDLASLLEKVKSAKGADRQLDWHIADATGHESFNTTIQGMWPPFMKGSRADKAVPAYTASGDASLALVERKLPGWYFDHIGADAVGLPMQLKTVGWTVELSSGHHLTLDIYQGQAPTLPLAILAAMLTALISQETTNGN
jgi:hypothetical protein